MFLCMLCLVQIAVIFNVLCATLARRPPENPGDPSETPRKLARRPRGDPRRPRGDHRGNPRRNPRRDPTEPPRSLHWNLPLCLQGVAISPISMPPANADTMLCPFSLTYNKAKASWLGQVLITQTQDLAGSEHAQTDIAGKCAAVAKPSRSSPLTPCICKVLAGPAMSLLASQCAT